MSKVTVASQERPLFGVWERICARRDEVGLAGLEHRDRVFAAIWMLEAEVNNGGFPQWMFNSWADHAELTVAGLRDVGAEEVARVCERFFALLPGGRPGADQDERQRQLDEAVEAVGEEAFEAACVALEQELQALEDDLRDRLCRYCTG